MEGTQMEGTSKVPSISKQTNKQMKYKENQVYHVFNQGNNQQPLFFERENYLYFLRKMRKHLLPYADILCYCLMPNHFHWLICPNNNGLGFGKSIMPNIKLEGTSEVPSNSRSSNIQQNLSQQIGILLSSYTKAINKRYNRTGSLFRSKTKVKDGIIDELMTVNGTNRQYFFRPDNDYILQCFKYIHQNPVKAGLVENAENWEFSSAIDYKGIRKGTMCNYELARKLMS